MRARLLGPLEVFDGARWRSIRSVKHRALLGILVAARGLPVSLDQLVDEVWDGEPPDTGGNLIRQYVRAVRRALRDPSGELLRTIPSGYRLVLDEGDLDIPRFENLTTAGVRATREADHLLAAELLASALALWRGPAFADVQQVLSVRTEVARLERLRLTAHEARIQAAIQLGHHENLTGELQDLVARFPLHEPFWLQLMLTLSSAGRRAEALEHYQRARTALVEQLGIDPGPAMQELHQRILRGDPDSGPAIDLAPVPRQIPASATFFVGRQLDLVAIDIASSKRRAVVTIHGLPGVGKTALAVHWGNQTFERFPDGQLYVDLRGFDPHRSPVDAGEALGGFLRALGVDPRTCPTSKDERSALFRTLTADRRMLLVLDNAANTEQVRPLLPAGPCLVLVTSRHQLPGLVALDDATSLALGPLSPSDSLALLTRVLGAARVEAEADAAAELTELCGQLPLALRVVAARLVMRPRQRLHHAAGELRTAGLAALELHGEDGAALAAAFDASLAALDEQSRDLFRLLGHMPGADFGIAAASVLASAKHGSIPKALDLLATSHFVDMSAPGRYRLHDLVRRYAGSLPGASTAEPVSRLIRWYLRTTEHAASKLYPHHRLLDHNHRENGIVDRSAAWAWFEQEHDNLVAVVEMANSQGHTNVAWHLANAMRSYFLGRTGNYQPWLSVASTGLAAAERTGDPRALAAIHLSIGLAHWGLGDYHHYLDHSTQAFEAARSINWDRVTAKASSNIGHALVELGQPKDAIHQLSQAIDLKRQVDSKADLAHSLVILGSAYAHMGNKRQALQAFREACELTAVEDAGPERIHALYGLGMVLLRQGETVEGETALQSALTAARAQIHPDREATILAGLAEAAPAAKADTLLDGALRLCVTGVHPATPARVNNTAGRIHNTAGRSELALTHHRRALESADRTDNLYDATEALLGLARAHLAIDDPDAARTYAEQARANSEHAGYRALYEQALGFLT